jgi:tetratricopeptide (TPR) repeat protein
LLFSDGKVAREGRNFERVFSELAESTLSASSIAIGPKADLDFLWRLAEEGSGVKYPVKDARDLPEITLEELIRLERARWIKGPVPVEPGPFASDLRKLDPDRIPPVDGYVLTFEKPTAQTSMVVRAGDLQTDPLVSHWRYWLGVVLVLNTSFGEEGLDHWLNWEGLSELSTELLSRVYSESPLQPGELTVRTRREGSRLTVTAEAERDGRWLDLLVLEGRLSAAEGGSRSLAFEQIGPGRYQVTIEDLPEGIYLLSVGEESLGRVEEAIQALEETLSRNPYDRQTILALATFERERGRLDAAIEYAQRTVDLWPGDPMARQLLSELRDR